MTACQRVIVMMTAVRLCRFPLTLLLSQDKREEGSGHIVQHGRLLFVPTAPK